MALTDELTKKETLAALDGINSWAVQNEILEIVEERHGGDFADFFKDLESVEPTLSINLFDVLNSIAAFKYDERYNGEALDYEGNAWFSGVMVGLIALDSIASRKSVDAKSYRRSMFQSEPIARFHLNKEAKAEEIAKNLGIVDEIGNRSLGDNGYSQLATDVALGAFNESHMYQAFSNGYNFTMHTGKRAVVATWISSECERGLELLLNQGQ